MIKKIKTLVIIKQMNSHFLPRNISAKISYAKKNLCNYSITLAEIISQSIFQPNYLAANQLVYSIVSLHSLFGQRKLLFERYLFKRTTSFTRISSTAARHSTQPNTAHAARATSWSATTQSRHLAT